MVKFITFELFNSWVMITSAKRTMITFDYFNI